MASTKSHQISVARRLVTPRLIAHEHYISILLAFNSAVGGSVNERYARANLGPNTFCEGRRKESPMRDHLGLLEVRKSHQGQDKNLCKLTVRSGGSSSARWHFCSRIEGITPRVLVYCVHVKIHDTKVVLPISFIATSDNRFVSGTHVFNTNSEYIFKQELRLGGLPAGEANGKRRSAVRMLRKVELKDKCKYTEYLKDDPLRTTKRSL